MRRLICTPLTVTALCACLCLGSCSQSKTKLHLYSMGQRVEIGHIIYTVLETQWLTQIGEGVNAKVPQNRFFLVRLSAANSGNEKLSVPAISVEDDSGKSYQELPNGDGIPQWVSMLREIKPAESLQGNVAFDAPPGHYKMLLSDEDQTNTAYVDIPLTFNAETPEAPLPSFGQGKE
ncbi:MAG: DUF4352 domain-containing protein [Bryobacteraceae bacterium]|jgi:hypothetical protein